MNEYIGKISFHLSTRAERLIMVISYYNENKCNTKLQRKMLSLVRNNMFKFQIEIKKNILWLLAIVENEIQKLNFVFQNQKGLVRH